MNNCIEIESYFYILEFNIIITIIIKIFDHFSAILSVADMNLLILNRDTFNFFDEFYTTNITIPRVGKILADFIKLLIENGSDPKQFYLIGFGAGAQIVSLAAKEIKPPVSRILGKYVPENIIYVLRSMSVSADCRALVK